MSRSDTTRGTTRKLPQYLHWTQRRGAKRKLALAVKRRARTRRRNQ